MCVLVINGIRLNRLGKRKLRGHGKPVPPMIEAEIDLMAADARAARPKRASCSQPAST